MPNSDDTVVNVGTPGHVDVAEQPVLVGEFTVCEPKTSSGRLYPKVTKSLQEETKTDMMRSVLQAEINDLITISAQYQSEINTAKTNIKKIYIKKKLKKNNDKLFEMLVAFDKHNKNKNKNENNKLAGSDN